MRRSDMTRRLNTAVAALERRRSVARGLLACAVGVALGGCVGYRPPGANEPNAVIHVERRYARIDGPRLRERTLSDEDVLAAADGPSTDARRVRTSSLLVRPGPTVLRVESTFFHTETRVLQQTHYERIPDQLTPNPNCPPDPELNCQPYVVTYRGEMQTRSVPQTVEVENGACEERASLTARDGSSYWLVYEYQGDGACSLECFERRGPGQRPEARPC
jgi:hypothetical protein